MPDFRILIVEDSPTQAEGLRYFLEENELDAEIARSAEAALEILAERRFDIVLSDVMMPGLNGYELCVRIKSMEAPPAVILLTSQNHPGDVVRGLAAGADNYITKPYDPGQLLARIERVRGAIGQVEAAGSATSDVEFLGENFSIGADRPQILGFLLAAFEDLARSNTELEASKRAAESATRARDEVLATVSHDLRNPLATIYTSAAMMLEMSVSEHIRTQQIALIHRTANRMMRLLEDLLDVSRMDAGHFSVNREAQPIGDIMGDVLEMLQPVAAAQGLSIMEDIVAPETQVLADRNRLIQAITNVTANAVKFTPAGGTISLATRNDAEMVTLEITDTGAGIPAHHLPHIFNRFYQVEGGPTKTGAGLGLAIVKGIVEAHGGTVEVRSTVGEGTTFSITLPRG